MEPDTAAVRALNHAFLARHPVRAAEWLERRPPAEAAALLGAYPSATVQPVWDVLSLAVAEALLSELPPDRVGPLLARMDPVRCAVLLRRAEPERRERLLALVPASVARELRTLLAYPPNTAGALMDPHFLQFSPDEDVEHALAAIRSQPDRARRDVLLVDEDGRPEGRVTLQALALADPAAPLSSLRSPIEAVVRDIAPLEDLTEALERHRITKIPVVSFDGRLVGVIRQEGLIEALRTDTSVDVQTMVGASREERALSRFTFAVRKRLPWLEINLLTAFLAASVVALFEDTIARFTALAVLLPVVAGQSGNAGAQALAVTMRGLAVREVSVRHWAKVVRKEVLAGFTNGVAVGLTTSAAVLVWSGSVGLALVIGSSMIIAMVAAGFSGAIIPIALVRVGQDPAQSSSIILTTVTDVVGFFSFLGIATALASLL